jgi:hypothetical protein
METISPPGRRVELKATVSERTSDEIVLKYAMKNLSVNKRIFVFDQLLSFGENGELSFED